MFFSIDTIDKSEVLNKCIKEHIHNTKQIKELLNQLLYSEKLNERIIEKSENRHSYDIQKIVEVLKYDQGRRCKYFWLYTQGKIELHTKKNWFFLLKHTKKHKFFKKSWKLKKEKELVDLLFFFQVWHYTYVCL